MNQTVAGLNTLPDNTDTLMGKRAWNTPAQEVNSILTAQIDHVFWRALMLIVAFFALLFVYRVLTTIATRRWLKPA